MKSLKITLLLVAVLLLTVSGQSSDTVADTNEPTYKEHKSYNLLAHTKKKLKVQTQG